ncbi:hypothetical protein POTOM_037089 [Populus tomentosa]|uniref:tyrosine--tRNA ligase n=1 Tax=Populus tomentosa TaxID=118781 RepID=A0A8X8CFJ2_POPTO|nr:hypothetical protein POTOM_037089 [Populus tomentosa]
MIADVLPGLQQGQEKMSKSDPSSSIFMEDEEQPATMEENDQTPPSEEMRSLTVTPSASSSSNPTTPQLLSLEEKFQLVRSVGEECIQEDEPRHLLEKKPLPFAMMVLNLLGCTLLSLEAFAIDCASVP